MTTEEAWAIVNQSRELLKPVRDEFPCEWCGGDGGRGDYNYDPCVHCCGTGYHIQDEEDE